VKGFFPVVSFDNPVVLGNQQPLQQFEVPRIVIHNQYDRLRGVDGRFFSAKKIDAVFSPELGLFKRDVCLLDNAFSGFCLPGVGRNPDADGKGRAFLLLHHCPDTFQRFEGSLCICLRKYHGKHVSGIAGRKIRFANTTLDQIRDFFQSAVSLHCTMPVVVKEKGVYINERKRKAAAVSLVALDLAFQRDLEKTMIEKTRQTIGERRAGSHLVVIFKLLHSSGRVYFRVLIT